MLKRTLLANSVLVLSFALCSIDKSTPHSVITTNLSTLYSLRDPDVAKKTRWTGIWFTGLRLTNAPPETEIVGLVFNIDPSSLRSRSNTAPESTLVLQMLLTTPIVSSFRSDREMKLSAYVAELDHASIDWIHATFTKESGWTFAEQAPPQHDLDAKESFARSPLGATDAGFAGRPVLAVLPEPLDKRGLGIVSRKLKGSALPAIWPADVTCNWVLSWEDAANQLESKREIKEIVLWIDGHKETRTSDLRLVKSP